MFTGITTDIGIVHSVEDMGSAKQFRITSSYSVNTITVGASICHSGCCLTVRDMNADGKGSIYTVDASPETLVCTTLGEWRPGSEVNLERSMALGDELGGHLVTGHIDGVAEIIEREVFGENIRFTIKAPSAIAHFIAVKGSVALDGNSLTCNRVEGDHFDIMLIPHTLAITTWKDRIIGDFVNIEADLMARYAARLRQVGENEA